jgi:thiamine transporter
VAYTALGLGGFFRGKAWGIFPCVVLGSLGRFAVHYFSGITLYRIIEPTGIEGLEGLGMFTNPHLYSLVYNGVYMLPNLVIAVVITALLYVPMKKFFAGSDIRSR